MTLFPDIAESGADLVTVILPAPAQITLLGQYEDSGGLADLLERLGSGRAFDTAKGSLAFDERGQLRQQLYAVVPVPDAGWGITLSDKLGVARLHRTLMVDAPESGPACR